MQRIISELNQNSSKVSQSAFHRKGSTMIENKVFQTEIDQSSLVNNVSKLESQRKKLKDLIEVEVRSL